MVEVYVIKAVYFSLFSISLLIGGATFGISIKNKFHKQFLSELMLTIIGSEIFYVLTRYLALVRSGDFNPMKKHLAVNTIQLGGSIFCDCCTLLATIIITLKIFDGIVTKSRYFNKFSIRLGSRCLIFIFSFGIMLMFTLLQLNGDLIRDDRGCNIIGCILRSELNKFVLGIFLFLAFIILAVILVFVFYLSQSKKKMSVEAVSNDAMRNAVSSIQCKLMIFPIISLVLWLWRLLYQLVITIMQNELVPQPVLWIYSVINCLRTVIYSVMYYVSHEDLRKAYRRLLCGWIENKKNNKKITSEQLMMKVTSSFNDNDKLVDMSIG